MRDYCDAQAGFWLNSKFWSKFSRPKFTLEYPLPHFRKLQIWDDQSLLRNTPPISENFRFGMTKVYSGIPPPPPFQKTSDLGWPKFTPEYPPHFRKTSDLGWPKFTPEYPPPPQENCQRVEVRDFLNTEIYYMWRLYPTRITTSLGCLFNTITSLRYSNTKYHTCVRCFS